MKLEYHLTGIAIQNSILILSKLGSGSSRVTKIPVYTKLILNVIATGMPSARGKLNGMVHLQTNFILSRHLKTNFILSRQS